MNQSEVQVNYFTINIYLPFKCTSNMFCLTPFVLDNSSRIVLMSCKKTNLQTKKLKTTKVEKIETNSDIPHANQ